MLAARFGNLTEAEAWYRKALVLAERVNEPIYISLMDSYLATVMQEQGKLDEAKLSLHQALSIGRTKNIASCVGFALVALAYLRIAQSLAIQENNPYSLATIKQQQRRSSIHLLQRARTSLQRALAFEELEAETRTEGKLKLAQVSLLLGEMFTAQQQTLQVIDEARRHEQTWLLACAQRLMGSILSAQGQVEDASTHFAQALETLQKCGMRLEWARTLRSYGEALLQHANAGENGYTEGLRYLQDARHAFQECNAVLDLQLVEGILSEKTTPALAPPHKKR
jgi:tetratricopeptide (TPR) repeat protein